MTPELIAQLLQPYTDQPIKQSGDLPPIKPDWPKIHAQLAIYLDLILKWNARTNLTAIRTPEEIVQRHFGESLFAGAHLGACATLLDFGSGAGFPGLPIQLLRPDIAVTLAESQGKKAAFLREVIRSLGLPAKVWAHRVEAMPHANRFDVVTLRAVDNMETAVHGAILRVKERVLIMGNSRPSSYPKLAADFHLSEPIPIPLSNETALLIAHRIH
ncbi:MAG: 16S rRNA (guanine(527)-N(7))-methyltransferase RsmG [Acidobacteriaceae bacterium]|nr:16S rRNA (guanine(527)-N(7))-methyltransferase RsmG [Acidobacteriaceae bacterium]